MAIIGVHALVYAKKSEQVRAFFRDVLGWTSVDAGEGWPIFAAAPLELAVHPTEGDEWHELYLMCDDIRATVADLKAKGISTSPVQDQDYGLVTTITMPGGGGLGLYEPRHPLAIKPARKSRPTGDRQVRRKSRSS